MSATIIRLWLVRETELARLYCKHRPEQVGPLVHVPEEDCVWVPKSIIEHTTKRGNEHEVKLPDWFIEKQRL